LRTGTWQALLCACAILLLAGCGASTGKNGGAAGSTDYGYGPAPRESQSGGSTQAEPGAPGSEGAAPRVTELTIRLVDYGFEPANVTVPAGTTVRLQLENTGKIAHKWVVPALAVDSGIVDGGKSGTLEFTASRAGSFQIVCDLRGHKDRGSVGTLTVE
jgi:uncharacterized cupredoxin-like copper-binding protein